MLEIFKVRGLDSVFGGSPWATPSSSERAKFKSNKKMKTGKYGLKQLVLFAQKLYNLINSRVELLSALRL